MSGRVLSHRAGRDSYSRSSQGQKAVSRDTILQCLTRLNEKATQRSAAEELSAIVQALDADSLSFFISSICNTGAWEPRPSVRKDCIRALGQLASTACPAKDLALQQHLGRLLLHIKKHMQDADSAVRDACCEALAAIAEGLVHQSGNKLPGTHNNPVVKMLFDCLAEQKKEAQVAASQALLELSPYLAPLDKDLVKVVLRLLKSSTFAATPGLLAALASSHHEKKTPHGLLKAGSSAFLPYIHHLVGQSSPHGPPSGVLGCLSSKDWAVRRAAGDTLRAMTVLLGPFMEPEGRCDVTDPATVTGKCLQALESARFDKVREARDAARDAMAVVHELVAFMQQGGTADGWPLWASEHIAAAGSPIKVSNPSSFDRNNLLGVGGGSLERNPSITERFHKAAAAEDLIAEPGSIGSDRMGEQADQQEPGSCEVQDMGGTESDRSGHEGSGEGSETDGEGTSPADGEEGLMSAACAGATEVSSNDGTAEQPAGAGAAAGTEQGAWINDVPGDDAELADVVVESTGEGAEVTDHDSPGFVKAVVAEVNNRLAALGIKADMSPKRFPTPGGVSRQEYQELRAEVLEMKQQQVAQATLLQQLSEKCFSAIAALQGRVEELQHLVAASPAGTDAGGSSSLETQQPAAVTSQVASKVVQSLPSTPYASPYAGFTANSANGSSPLRHPALRHVFSASGDFSQRPLVSTGSLPSPYRGLSASMTSLGRAAVSEGGSSSPHTPGGRPADINELYDSVLKQAKGDIQLVRLIQRTGPVWAELQRETAIQLLKVFINNVQEGAMLHRVMPWLWRLADVDCQQHFTVPQDLREELIVALAASPYAEDPQGQEKVKLLLESLHTVWQ